MRIKHGMKYDQFVGNTGYVEVEEAMLMKLQVNHDDGLQVC